MTKPSPLPSEYIAGLRDALAQVDLDAVRQAAARLDEARRAGRMIFVIGNGGSAATASHFAADLNKLASVGSPIPFKAHALSDNIALLTAWANDAEFGNIFEAQLINFAQADDVLVAITTSGRSDNISRAMSKAEWKRMTKIVLTAQIDSVCALQADICILTPAPRQTQQEDIALAVCHMLAEALR